MAQIQPFLGSLGDAERARTEHAAIAAAAPFVDVPMPIELYHAAHAAIQEAAGDTDYGMLVHIAWATDAGFQLTEVWQSKEHCERFDVEVAVR